jgi:hypothetical protein
LEKREERIENSYGRCSDFRVGEIDRCEVTPLTSFFFPFTEMERVVSQKRAVTQIHAYLELMLYERSGA